MFERGVRRMKRMLCRNEYEKKTKSCSNINIFSIFGFVMFILRFQERCHLSQWFGGTLCYNKKISRGRKRRKEKSTRNKIPAQTNPMFTDVWNLPFRVFQTTKRLKKYLCLLHSAHTHIHHYLLDNRYSHPHLDSLVLSTRKMCIDNTFLNKSLLLCNIHNISAPLKSLNMYGTHYVGFFIISQIVYPHQSR